MGKNRRQLRTIPPAALREVRGGTTLTLTASAPPPASDSHEEQIELISISFGPVRP